jgi:uncharacterized protein (DUF2236 family)
VVEVMSRALEPIRLALVGKVHSFFSHAEDPLANTLSYAGDPGLFGPESVTWEVMGDIASLVGGIRALMIQAAHPEVVAGVADHSRYREDPLGRLSRTSNYVTATAYGAMPEVHAAIAQVRAAHRRIRGISHRGIPYSAASPEYAAWVHNSLTDSFLVANQVFGPRALTRGEADRFVAEQTATGRMLRAHPLPETADALDAWIADHPGLEPSPGMVEAIAFLRDPPIGPITQHFYRILARAAAATIPPRVRHVLGLRAVPGAINVGRVSVASLRWILGSSPVWRIALLRAGAPIPEERFKQKLPFRQITGPPGYSDL